MINALTSLKSLIRAKSYHIDYPLFRLHYQATASALLAFCLILTAKILFGDTIDCKSRVLGRDPYYDNLCYSQGTFTMYAVDSDNLRKLAAQQHGYSYDKQVTKREDSNNSTLSPTIHNLTAQAPILPPSDEDLGIFKTAANYALKTLYPSEYEKLPKPEARSAAGAPQQQLTSNNLTTLDKEPINYTYAPIAFPIRFLAGTGAGDFLKNNFRNLHKLIRNDNYRSFQTVKYLYTGITIPNNQKEQYSITFWHSYYQYIPIILFLQAILFYLPHYLWKNWENGVVSSVCKQLHDNRFAPAEYIDSNYHMIDYLQNCFTLNKSLVFKYYSCHLILLINLIVQVIMLNTVFNNQFVTYGLDVFNYLFIDSDLYGLRGIDRNVDELNSPMDFVFPKITACSIKTLSQAGKNPDNNQFLCVLPLNILHDKFFLILWVWFFILGTLTVIQIIFDTLYATLPTLRKYLFKRRYGPYLSRENRHSSSLTKLFLLDLIGSNSDKFAFSVLLKKLNKEEWRSDPSMEDQSLV